MRNVFLLVFIMLVLSVSCQNNAFRNQARLNYKKSISFFNKDLVNHFPPPEYSDNLGTLTNVLQKGKLAKYCFGICEIISWENCSDSGYVKKTERFKKISKQIYSPIDSSLLLVFPYSDVIEVEGTIFRDQESPEKQQLAKHNITKANSLPIPLFEIDKFSGNTISGLSEDFKLYLLDAKPGKFIEDMYLYECDCLPEKWKHGYSKGVALSDEKKVIIYWIVVW